MTRGPGAAQKTGLPLSKMLMNMNVMVMKARNKVCPVLQSTTNDYKTKPKSQKSNDKKQRENAQDSMMIYIHCLSQKPLFLHTLNSHRSRLSSSSSCSTRPTHQNWERR